MSHGFDDIAVRVRETEGALARERPVAKESPQRVRRNWQVTFGELKRLGHRDVELAVAALLLKASLQHLPGGHELARVPSVLLLWGLNPPAVLFACQRVSAVAERDLVKIPPLVWVDSSDACWGSVGCQYVFTLNEFSDGLHPRGGSNLTGISQHFASAHPSSKERATSRLQGSDTCPSIVLLEPKKLIRPLLVFNDQWGGLLRGTLDHRLGLRIHLDGLVLE